MAINFDYEAETDLRTALQKLTYPGFLVSGDNRAHNIKVTVKRGSENVNVSGIVAKFLQADGTTVSISGTSSGNVATITLPGGAYSVPGYASMAVKATEGTVTNTIALIGFNVIQNYSSMG